ncbi:CPBP family intramembrane glutamic endopeptidase [Hyphobacterium marinum]|uniref:CPBP family intramembrane glutamic endopeptidase n=1 Tax=Hyphobacterium marinum TaxID=3116574 RepID=A0ABU7LVB7_9PROT|nr:CPBP family intramembrane glutamic endopeptidase [Hyphobacterium sp. Y6023]MEE2565497.1 CPBP family intramembrane glutamic endopeptidase [Hyphobacterium sp. Y6023]
MSGLSPADYLLLIPVIALAVFLAISPLRDSKWKARIRAGEDPRARLKFYRETMVLLWGVAILCLAFWLVSGRTLAGLGFGMTVEGWRGGLAWGAALASFGYMVWSTVETARSRSTRQSVRRQIDAMGGLDMIRAKTSAEHTRFLGVAITAGITEEIIFRGFLIGALALVMPVWAAAAVSVAAFTLGHIYQGPSGMIRVFVIALVLTGIFLIGGSLWPVIILHIAMDLSSGLAFRLVDRHAEADAAAEAASAA